MLNKLLVWLVLGPLVFLYYTLMAISSGRWSTIGLKTGLVYQAVWEKHVQQKTKKRGTLREYRSRSGVPAGADQFQNPVR